MFTLLNRFHGGLAWIGLGLCLTFGNVAGAEHTEDELEALHKQYNEQFWTYLQTSQYDQLRTSSAIRLLRSEEPSLRKKGAQMVNEVLNKAVIDPATLWLIAVDCRWRKSANWCESGEVYNRLRLADPHNAAVLILEFSNKDQPDDESLLAEEARLQFLEAAAAAKRYDVYWARGVDKTFEEALKFIKGHPTPPFPSDYPVDIQPYAYAFTLATMYWITAPTSSYGEVSRLCRELGHQQDAKGMELCITIARTMQENGNTILTRTVGFGIEKAVLEATEPDSPAIQTLDLRKEAHSVIPRCHSQLWINHVDRWPKISQEEMMSLLKNLDELGEWDGYSLSLLQEYETAPETFTVNPVECLGLLELDDGSLAKFMDGRSALEVWEQMQADTKIKSQE